MGPIGNAVLGLAFLAIGVTATFLMFHLWGYPFDHTTFKSAAPPAASRVHRILGYLYLAIYLYLMSQMVPRLWNYQVEFPARTVAHLMLGMAIGTILAVKIAIVRFFRHLQSSLVPFLGTALLICTVLLIGLSVPFAFRETYLRRQAKRGGIFSTENLERVRGLLAQAGLEDEVKRQELASRQGLDAGRAVLKSKCVQCHDLRTVLARPNTPETWRETVRRMGDRSTVLSPISEDEQWQVTSYLIAISPELQRSVQRKLALQKLGEASQQAVRHLAEQGETPQRHAPGTFDSERARQLFRSRCSQCHSSQFVEGVKLKSEEEVRQLVARMVSNGATGTEEELASIIRYLTETYVKPTGQ